MQTSDGKFLFYHTSTDVLLCENISEGSAFLSTLFGLVKP